MKKATKKTRKLEIKKDVIRKLDAQNLDLVRGGATTRMTPPICSDRCCD